MVDFPSASSSTTSKATADAILSKEGKAKPGTREQQRQRTRALILQSVLDIIVSDGMRAVRHRAVAKRAGIALGTTTYHFTSIEDLIVSAFDYWQSQHQLHDNPYYQQMSTLLQPYENRAVEVTERSALLEKIYHLSVAYICDQLQGKREDRIVEFAFYHESLGSELIKDMVLSHWQFDINYMASVFSILGSEQPLDDARITLSLFRQLEQLATIANLPQLDVEMIRATLHRHFCSCLKVDFPL